MELLKLDIPDLNDCLRSLLAQIPAGRVTTYGRLAQTLGDPIAARWVGHYAMHHAHRRGCNCHRVVQATGRLGLYITGRAADKARRLGGEGVPVDDTRLDGPAVDLERFLFDDFQTTRPLAGLRELQRELAAKVRLSRRSRMPRLVGGVDVSYASADCATAAYALIDSRDGELVWSTTVGRPAAFPYITTYLTFRELPILLELLSKVREAGKSCPVLMVDGTGTLHPRRAGIASFLGVAAAWPTIGVIKKRLCGQVDLANMKHLESRTITLGGRPTGVAIRPTPQGHSEIFVSPGHRVNLDFATKLTRQMLVGRRLPAPIYHADRISRAVANDK